MRIVVLLIGVVLCMPVWALDLEQRPASQGEWGYRPADGAQVTLNPPGFSWRPTKDAARYVLEIGRDRAFDDIAYRSKPTPWSAHCPDKTLAPGTYFWRYDALDDQNTASTWSTVRTFTIPADAPAFPQPSIEELIHRMPQGHPRLFFRPEDIERFKKLAVGPLKDDWSGIQKKADRLLAHPPDSSEPPLYPKDVKYKSEEWKTIWWGNRRRVIAVADGAATLGFAYRISGDERYGKAARDLLMAMCSWDPEGSTRYRYNDEAAMPALYFTSRAYDWAYPVLSAKDRQQIATMMRIRGRQCFDHLRRGHHLWRPYSSHSNRAWHFLGEVAIAFHGDIPEADTWLDYAMTIFYTAYPVWGDSDGGWHEGTAYWSSYLNRFMYWAFVVDSAFDIDVFTKPFFKHTGYYGMYVLPPGTQHGGFADQSPRSTSKRIANLMAMLAAGAGNSHWLWYAEAASATAPAGYMAFFEHLRTTDLKAQAPTALPTSTCFHGVGIAALNTDLMDAKDNVQLLFKSSPFGTISHGYNANNAFHLNVGGKPLLENTGRRDVYGSPHHKQWMWTTKSQNAILVNGKGQYVHSPIAKGRIAVFKTTKDVDVAVGEAGSSYANLDRWTRRIVFLKPNVIIIHDLLKAPEASTYDWLAHAPGTFAMNGNQARYSADNGSVDCAFVYPKDLQVTEHDGYDPPPAEWAHFNLHEWHLSAQPAHPAKRQEFITVLRVNDARATWSLTSIDDVKRLDVTYGNRHALIDLGWDAFRVRYGDFDQSFRN